MTLYAITRVQRNSRRTRYGNRGPLRWYGPRYVYGRRSKRMTVVWTVRPRRMKVGVRP